MKTVKLKINGQDVEAAAGSTILEAARAAGVEIPTLCHHPALDNYGACRMCVVEVSNSPALQPACTYPATEGIEVQTQTKRPVDMRKFVLEMLFSERNHYCMFCEMSGDCELQDQAYAHGMDHWTFPTPYPRVPVDATRRHFLMDHNRCILCRRCVRACAELVGNHTLGVRSRGAKTMICADMDAPFGDSTCVGCGTCLQVCPTGALVDSNSAYRGRNAQVERTGTHCQQCSAGCPVRVVTRSGLTVRVEGDWDGFNDGVLCGTGRFDSLRVARERIRTPLVRAEGTLKPAEWSEALQRIASEFSSAGPGRSAARISGDALNETLEGFWSLFGNSLKVDSGTLEPTLATLNLPGDGLLSDLDASDGILVVGVDPLRDQKVVGYRIRRAMNREVRPLVVTDNGNSTAAFARRKYSRADLGLAVGELRRDKHPVVVYGAGITPAEADTLRALAGHAKFIGLYPSLNGRRARAMGLPHLPTMNGASAAFICAGERPFTAEEADALRPASFLAVLASRVSALTEIADVVLPAPVWAERSGTFVNLEGRTLDVRPAVAPAGESRSEVDVFTALSRCF